VYTTVPAAWRATALTDLYASGEEWVYYKVHGQSTLSRTLACRGLNGFRILGAGVVQQTSLSEIRSTPTRCVDCPVRARALFQVVSDDYLNDAEALRVAQYRLSARTHLYHERDAAAVAYTLFSGWLMLYRSHSDGSRQGLRIALPGDFVGYTPLAKTNYTHGALAVTDVTVCGFRQADLHRMIHTHQALSRQINEIQARDLIRCENNVLGLGRKSAEQRIVHVIVELYHRLRRRDMLSGDSSFMAFPLTQEMLGELAGLTPVHTNRILRKLRKDRLLIAERQRIEILDLDRLSELAELASD
jgi:CRP/FNR family transcriptional regulator, anaerobic regulatory protein